MKILHYFKSAKGLTIKIFLIICLGFCLNLTSYSNPIIPPPVILEIYFSSDNVYIELLISEFYGGTNLDNIRMTGLYDTAQFLPGIEYTCGVVFYVTMDDFETPFDINQAGDYLSMEEFYAGEWHSFDYWGLAFGDNVSFSDVSAPQGDESIACQLIWDAYGYDNYWTVKEIPNTIGSSPFQVLKRAEFSGYVKDINNAPLKNIELQYCWDLLHYGNPPLPVIITDENGYFYSGNMFCRNYSIDFLYEEGKIGDTTISVEPDSANYFEFKLDTLLTGIAEFQPVITSYSIYNIPNPFLNNTTFVIETNGKVQNQKGVIKIYTSEGYIIDILPLEIYGERQELNYNRNDKSLAAGIYYYSLEIGKEKKASEKMVISR
jgi:hypothetical protein